MSAKFLRTVVAAAFPVVGVLLFGIGQATAVTLLDLEDPAGQTNTPYSLSFIAGSAATDIQFAGYQLPSALTATGISLGNGGGNLLGLVWTFTPAPSGTLAAQIDDGLGTGTNAVEFAGVTEDSFDLFDQIVSTTVGQTYTLSFLFTNSSSSEPSELMVSASNANLTAVPEPATLALLSLGLAGLGFSRRNKA